MRVGRTESWSLRLISLAIVVVPAFDLSGGSPEELIKDDCKSVRFQRTEGFHIRHVRTIKRICTSENERA
jgi:hypothetical protein